MAVVNGGLDTVLYDHEKRIRDLERRPLGCLEYHDHFYVIAQHFDEIPPPDVYGGPGVGYLVMDSGTVWALTGTPLVWNDGPGRTLDDWLPDPTPTDS